MYENKTKFSEHAVRSLYPLMKTALIVAVDGIVGVCIHYIRDQVINNPWY